MKVPYHRLSTAHKVQVPEVGHHETPKVKGPKFLHLIREKKELSIEAVRKVILL